MIAAVLKDKELADLLALTHELGLTALIEVHDRAELERVLSLQPRLIGVNNRDLRDFSVDLSLCIELRQHVPAERVELVAAGPGDEPLLSAAIDRLRVRVHGLSDQPRIQNDDYSLQT